MRLSVFIIPVLVVAVFGSAVGVIDAAHRNRKLFAELQQLRQHRDQLNVEWGRLQLEESAWATHARIEQLAHKDLGMVMPRQTEMIVVRRP